MSLTQLQGSAVRDGGNIEVSLFGRLNNSCATATITGSSAGSSGGPARVDIKTGTKPGSHFCLFIILPWVDGTIVADKSATELEVFVDDTSRLKLSVLQEKPTQFEVYRGLNGEGCLIVPEGTIVPGVYSHVFGPASRAECEKFVAENCGDSI